MCIYDDRFDLVVPKSYNPNPERKIPTTTAEKTKALVRTCVHHFSLILETFLAKQNEKLNRLGFERFNFLQNKDSLYRVFAWHQYNTVLDFPKGKTQWNEFLEKNLFLKSCISFFCSQGSLYSASKRQVQGIPSNRYAGRFIIKHLFLGFPIVTNFSLKKSGPWRNPDSDRIPLSRYHDYVANTSNGCSMFDVYEMSLLFRYEKKLIENYLRHDSFLYRTNVTIIEWNIDEKFTFVSNPDILKNDSKVLCNFFFCRLPITQNRNWLQLFATGVLMQWSKGIATNWMVWIY